MNKLLYTYLFIVIIFTFMFIPFSTFSEETPKATRPAAPFPYLRIYADAAGESHFSDDKMSFILKNYAPPLPPMSVTKPMDAGKIVFLSNPVGWAGDWHPTPRRQFIIVLAGEYEIEVSDGAVRRMRPGSMLLVENTTGKGHRIRNISAEQGYVVAIPVPLPVKE